MFLVQAPDLYEEDCVAFPGLIKMFFLRKLIKTADRMTDYITLLFIDFMIWVALKAVAKNELLINKLEGGSLNI